MALTNDQRIIISRTNISRREQKGPRNLPTSPLCSFRRTILCCSQQCGLDTTTTQDNNDNATTIDDEDDVPVPFYAVLPTNRATHTSTLLDLLLLLHMGGPSE
eukprot:scaffold248349_cov76-Cyclotella_meneghiniana.AAC.7